MLQLNTFKDRISTIDRYSLLSSDAFDRGCETYKSRKRLFKVACFLSFHHLNTTCNLHVLTCSSSILSHESVSCWRLIHRFKTLIRRPSPPNGKLLNTSISAISCFSIPVRIRWRVTHGISATGFSDITCISKTFNLPKVCSKESVRMTFDYVLPVCVCRQARWSG